MIISVATQMHHMKKNEDISLKVSYVHVAGCPAADIGLYGLTQACVVHNNNNNEPNNHANIPVK